MNGVCLVIEDAGGIYTPVYECHTPERLADIVSATFESIAGSSAKLLAIKVG